MRKRTHPFRYFFLGALPVAVCLVFFARLVNLQLVSADLYDYVSEKTYTRTVTVPVQRGEIYDRNGVLLVGNRYSYNLLLDYGEIPADAVGFNRTILTVIHLAADCGESEKLTEPEYPLSGTADAPVFTEDYASDGKKREKLVRLLIELGYGDKKKSEEERQAQAESITAPELRSYLLLRYKLIAEETGEALYSADDTQILLERRFSLDYIRFSPTNSYLIAEDVSMRFLTAVSETGQRGIFSDKRAQRVYYYPGYASHILGRVGDITAETKEKYLALGYPLNAKVGISGAEEAFESYLHGTDGVEVIVEDEKGNIIQKYWKTEPVAGQDIRLTIDINIQIAAEDSLARNIEKIAEEGKTKPGTLDGEDADAGACVAISPSTGEIFAIASYPTFDLSTYVEDLEDLIKDERAPLVNRALNGLYPPGSTFKPGTAAAALSEGVITPDTVIVDNGVYTYYKDYQPRCWYYLTYGLVHGPQTVVDAIHNSCNIFFFECGRLLTIERLNYYDRGFGLGEPTGIELPEKTGILAGPDYVESSGLGSWGPGDTLQAAIGQSYNTFTPLQLAVYLSSLTNCGTRYRAHLLHSSVDYATGNALFSVKPEAISTLSLSREVVDVVKNAMKNVPENGSTARIFEDYPITMGGKTGTAQVTKTRSDNGTFVAFAPLEVPEIVVAAVVEHGASGTPLGAVAKDIFDVYFGLTNADEENAE
ncbi:MAG: penicillin-binding transpeptidase domain-containing protein [Eubacteriales bacterium]|nr:penicillin-binding transpeptidase domain-containing protein [Eubacteriales bacterium]